MAHAFNPSTREAEAGGFLSSRPAWSQSEFQDSQDYTENPVSKNQKPKPKPKPKKKKKLLLFDFALWLSKTFLLVPSNSSDIF
jgi:hypothetical protein